MELLPSLPCAGKDCLFPPSWTVKVTQIGADRFSGRGHSRDRRQASSLPSGRCSLLSQTLGLASFSELLFHLQSHKDSVLTKPVGCQHAASRAGGRGGLEELSVTQHSAAGIAACLDTAGQR